VTHKSLSAESKHTPAVANRNVFHPESRDRFASESQILAGLTTSLVQPKLKIGLASDRYEQEADRVADHVMRMPDPEFFSSTVAPLTVNNGNAGMIQRLCVTCLEKYQAADQEERPLVSAKLCPECRIQTKPIVGIASLPWQKKNEEKAVTPLQARASAQTPAVTPNFASGIQSLRSGGRPLSHSERHFFEPRMGYDFSRVKIHTDNQADGLARHVHAKAFTLGTDVVFAAGQYQPQTKEGRNLMAHELTHVVQQQTPSPFNPAGSGPQIMRRGDSSATTPSGGSDRETTSSTASSAQPEQWATDVDLGRFSRYGHGRADARLNRRAALEHARRGGGGDAPPCQLDLFLKLRFNFHLGPSPYRQGQQGSMTQPGPPWPAARATRWKHDYMRVAQEMWRTPHPLERSGNCSNEPCGRAVGQLRIIDADTMTDSEGQQVTGSRMSNQPHFRVNVYEYRPWAGQLESRVGLSQSTLYAEDVLPRGTARPEDLDERPVPSGVSRPPLFAGERYRWMPGSAVHETGHMLGRPHVNCGPDVENPNEERCYGETDAQRANVMGRGSEFNRQDHAPFIAAMRAMTNCEWRVRSEGWPWWAYLLLAVPVVGWIALGILGARGIL